LEGHRGSVVGMCPYSTWFRFVIVCLNKPGAHRK
jgi:hypothetical protein